MMSRNCCRSTAAMVASTMMSPGRAKMAGCRSTVDVGRRMVFAPSTATSLSSFSTDAKCGDFVTTEIIEQQKKEGHIAIVTMQRPPVNSLSMEMCHALSDTIKTLEQNKSIQGMVLKSSSPTIFSAGLDLTEMHQPNEERLIEFWKSFQQLYIDLYGTRFATVAAIQGHAPAAGCFLALACDYRVMNASPMIKIGLNESQLGIVAPTWLGQMMIDTIGRRNGELALTLGTLYTPTEAKEINLIDRLVDDNDQLLDIATNDILRDQFLQIPTSARLASKMMIRENRIERMIASRQHDLDHFVSFITQEKTQQALGGYLAMLMAKKTKK